MTEWLLVGVGVLLTIGTALFVTAEFSLVALDRSRVTSAAEAGDAGARSVLGSLRTLSTQLSAAQVGITLTTLALGYLATPSVGQLLAGPVARAGVPVESAAAVASLVALIVATLFSMVFGELVPQFLGISEPLPMAKIVAAPVRMFALVMRPLIIVLNGSANAILESLGIEPQEELSAARTPQELASIVRRSAQAGTLDEDLAERVTRSLDFGSRTAADVMTPRVRCVSVDRTATVADVVELARRTGHSRFPVLGDDWDDVDGMVHVKKAVAVPHERRARVPVSGLMTPPTFVPETIGLDPLLVLLRRAGHQIAIVVDEYGGTSGVVTLEDVVEELVGEVADEHDRTRSTARRDARGRWSVPGMWRPDEVREKFGAEVPDSGAYETVGGFVMAVLGRLPAVGDEVRVPGWVVRVEAMEGRRVDRVRFVPSEPPPTAEKEPS
jgi:CBS domain containing-hemolysin-like protein